MDIIDKLTREPPSRDNNAAAAQEIEHLRKKLRLACNLMEFFREQVK